MKMPPDHFWDFMEDGDLSKFAEQEAKTKHLTYAEIYRNLDGMTALATAAATPLRRQKDEKDTAFVKRIVATYIKLHAEGSYGHDTQAVHPRRVGGRQSTRPEEG